MTHALKLVSFDICPYVERSRIVLEEKGLPYQIEFIDLKAKPDWFLRISPMGKVPVLLVDERPIFESMVINELIEEMYPSPRMMPKAPLDRAEARSWIVFANDALMPTSYKTQLTLATLSREHAEHGLETMRALLAKLETALGKTGGPFFLGREFTLVDATYAPFIRRWKETETWQETKLLPGFPKLLAYAERLLAHPSVVKADPGNVGPRLKALLQERAASGHQK